MVEYICRATELSGRQIEESNACMMKTSEETMQQIKELALNIRVGLITNPTYSFADKEEAVERLSKLFYGEERTIS